MTRQMSSISEITSSCRGFVDQMNRSAKGWTGELQRKYYNKVLNPMVGIAADYQSAAYDYMRLLDEYDRRIASLSGISPMGSGIGEHELYRQQIDPNLLAQMIYRQR